MSENNVTIETLIYSKLFLLLYFQDYMSDSESSEDEIEPKLKYVRLSNDIQSILLKSSATSIAVHPKVGFNFHFAEIKLFVVIQMFYIILKTNKAVF